VSPGPAAQARQPWHRVACVASTGLAPCPRCFRWECFLQGTAQALTYLLAIEFLAVSLVIVPMRRAKRDEVTGGVAHEERCGSGYARARTTVSYLASLAVMPQCVSTLGSFGDRLVRTRDQLPGAQLRLVVKPRRAGGPHGLSGSGL